MSNARIWMIFAASAIGWLLLSLAIAPSMSAVDVFYFRDAGWNLAAWGHFESAALARSHDLAPHLYAHYTPLMPALFAAYAAIFPRNAYAGTVFNLLLGLGAAAVALGCVLGQRPGGLRTAAALAIAALPVLFITYDRPESLGFILAVSAVGVATASGPRPCLGGLMVALAFLAHPFGAVAAGLWIALLLLAGRWGKPTQGLAAFRDVAMVFAMTLAGVVPVALVFYWLDPTSLSRFAANAFSVNSDLAVTAQTRSLSGFVHDHLHLNTSPLETTLYFLALAPLPVLAVWCIAMRKNLRAPEWFACTALLISFVFALALFPGHPHYVRFLALLAPVCLLVSAWPSSLLRAPALALLLYGMALGLPHLAIDLLQRVEQLPSFRLARAQPALLAARLDPNAVVVIEGDSYDVYKPYFRHLIQLDHAQDRDRYASVAAVANCYDAFHGAAKDVLPLPARLDATQFHLIQADPSHLWLTVFGHRVMHAQWGYGCDLYVRDGQPGQTARDRADK